MSATIFLVHGTGAQNAPWTQPGSALRTALESISPSGEVACEAVDWGGSNFHSKRIAGAAKLSAAIQSTVDREPQRKIVVVGHSHGGTVTSLMLARHPSIAPLLSGVVFLSTPFIVASRRPHTDGLKRMSESFLPILDALVCLLIAFCIYVLLSINSTLLEFTKDGMSIYIAAALFATGGKITCKRLEGVSVRRWITNIFAIHLGIFVPAALAALTYKLVSKFLPWTFLSVIVAVLAFACFAYASLRVLRRLQLLGQTVDDVSHISASIAQLLSDFQQTSLAQRKVLVVRFTSDEASLVLAVAQATTRALDLCVKALVGFFSTFGIGYWKAARRPLSLPKRIFWLAVLGVVLVLVTNTVLGLLSGILGLVFASIDSLVDALVHAHMPQKWDFSESIPVQFFEWLKPYLAWSWDPTNMRYHVSNPLAWVTLAVVTALSACSLVLALPFGAMSFWGALYVNFSVESAPAGYCDIVTFNPPTEGLLEDEGFWSTSSLAHSLAYLDERSIAAVKDRVASWIMQTHPDGSLEQGSANAAETSCLTQPTSSVP